MDHQALTPYGRALMDYFRGESNTQLIIRRDDGFEESLPASHFFRPPTALSRLETAAIDRCRGRVLDIGAGAGIHSLVLQLRGLGVTAIDINPQVVEIMRQRGVRDVHCADVLEFDGGPFDTLLMLGHGIGMVEDLAGMDRFLACAQGLARAEGQLLINSLDVRKTDEPVHLAYHEANRLADRYVGEIRFQFEYHGKTGPYLGWLHVDPHTLQRRATQARWEFEMIYEEENGDYLACLKSVQAT